MNQVRPVAKRDNLCTLSLFALNPWLFGLKYINININKLIRYKPLIFSSQILHVLELTTWV